MGSIKEHFANIIFGDECQKFISKIEPIDLQGDLIGEISLVISEMEEDKLKELEAKNESLKFVLGLIKKMAFSSNSRFYYKYKKSYHKKQAEYLQSIQQKPTIDLSMANTATIFLNHKQKLSPNDEHEVRIFNTFVQLGTRKAVADFYKIPIRHVITIVNKVKQELKQVCLQSLEA